MATMLLLSIVSLLRPWRTRVAGSGPTLIDCKPWVLPGQKPAKGRATHDPILRMEEYLTRKGLFDKKFKSKVTANFRRKLLAALKASTIA